MPKAYPYYDTDYKANVDTIRAWLDSHAANVFPVGRNGMHRYNNQDHSMYTAMLTVENLLGARHDVWSVNGEEEYHEINERPRDPLSGESGPTAGWGAGTPAGTGRAAPGPAEAAPAGPDGWRPDSEYRPSVNIGHQ